MEKRRREDDGGSNGRRGKPRIGGGGDANVAAAPADEEVEEFFAILKRIQVAVKYFEERDSRRGADTAAARRWRPTFEREDFDGVKTEAGGSESEGNQSLGLGLDLNSDPGCDVSDRAD